MGNKVTKTYIGHGSFTAPAGVTEVRLTAFKTPWVNTTYDTPRALSLYGDTQYLLDVSGALYAWGYNGGGFGNTGTVGNASATQAFSSPVLVVGSLSFRRMYFSGLTNQGYGTAYGLTTGDDAYAWGNNQLDANGNCGNSSATAAFSSPVLVVGSKKWASLSIADPSPTGGGKPTICGLTRQGDAYCWGSNLGGRAGSNVAPGTTAAYSSPIAVVGGNKFVSVAATKTAFAGLTDTGSVYCWGSSANGEVGNGVVATASLAYSSPVLVVGGYTFSQVYGGFANTFYALDTSGNCYAWGINTSGCLGVGDTAARSSPTLVVGGLKFAQLFMAGNPTVFGLTLDGKLYSWGANTQGKLGVGDVAARSSPTLVLGGLKFKKVVCANSTLGLTVDGIVYSWGTNTSGQLGTGDVTPRSSPVLVAGGPAGIYGHSVPTIDIGIGFSGVGDQGFAVSALGQIYSWGSNDGGLLGNSSATAAFSSPVLVVGPNNDVNPVLLTKDVVIPVVPGTTYNINVGAYYTTFGSYTIGNQVYTALQVTYDL